MVVQIEANLIFYLQGQPHPQQQDSVAVLLRIVVTAASPRTPLMDSTGGRAVGELPQPTRGQPTTTPTKPRRDITCLHRDPPNPGGVKPASSAPSTWPTPSPCVSSSGTICMGLELELLISTRRLVES